MDRVIARYVNRGCVNCGYGWVTAEVPLSYKWKGTGSECCPVHFEPGTVTTKVTREKALNTGFESPGLLRVLSFGGLYRRRECRTCTKCGHSSGRHHEEGCYKIHKLNHRHFPKLALGQFACECTDFSPCLTDKGSRTRWTTGEFSSEGIVVADVTMCPRCDSKSEVIRRKQTELAGRGRVAKQFAKDRGLEVPDLKSTSAALREAASASQKP